MKLNAKQLRNLINETIRNQVNESSSPYEDDGIVNAIDSVVSAVEEFMGAQAVNAQRLSDALWEAIDNELAESGASNDALPPPHPAGSMKGQW